MAVSLEKRVENINPGPVENKNYSVFSEQFLEKPDTYECGSGFTGCTIKKIPVWDDW